MSDNVIILLAVSVGIVITAIPFIRRAIRHKKVIRDSVPEQEITSVVQPKDQTPEEIYLLRYISPEWEPIGSRQSIRIRPEYYQRIRAITQVIGKNDVTLIAYLDNVLKAHFDDNRDIINGLYHTQMDELFKNGH